MVLLIGLGAYEFFSFESIYRKVTIIDTITYFSTLEDS